MDRIAVLGAGITGMTTAYALLGRGFDVTVYDRHRYPAMGDQLCQRRPTVGEQCGSVDDLCDRREGAQMDASLRCTLFDESAALLAQVSLDGRVSGQHPQLSSQYA